MAAEETRRLRPIEGSMRELYVTESDRRTTRAIEPDGCAAAHRQNVGRLGLSDRRKIEGPRSR